MEHLEKLLKDVILATQRIEASRKMYAAQIAPDFNAFNYIQTNELMLSQILADLLDPSKQHAQGDLFLKGFLKLLACDWSDAIDLNNSPNQKIQVTIEAQTKASNTQRRMDVYLTIKNDQHDIGLCIENKPFASDQKDQMLDYHVELEKRGHKLFHLVYLKYDGSDPSAESVPPEILENWLADKEITVLSYADLIPWLESCLGYIQNVRVEVFVKELIGYIQKRFLGVRDMNEKHEVNRLMIKSSESINAAFLIKNSIPDLQLSLMKMLYVQLKEKCDQSGWFIIAKDFKKINKRHFGLIFGKDNGSEYGFCIEFFGLNKVDCRIGLRRKSAPVESENDSKFKGLRSHLTQKLNYSTNDKSLWWPAWKNFQYKDWELNADPWVAIETGEMATLLIAEAEQLFNLLDESGKTDLLTVD
jgi:hypothetical protein